MPRTSFKLVNIIQKNLLLYDKIEKISLLSNHIHYREAYITGSHGSTPMQHKMALGMISRENIKVGKLNDIIKIRFSNSY